MKSSAYGCWLVTWTVQNHIHHRGVGRVDPGLIGNNENHIFELIRKFCDSNDQHHTDKIQRKGARPRLNRIQSDLGTTSDTGTTLVWFGNQWIDSGTTQVIQEPLKWFRNHSHVIWEPYKWFRNHSSDSGKWFRNHSWIQEPLQGFGKHSRVILNNFAELQVKLNCCRMWYKKMRIFLVLNDAKMLVFGF